MQKKKTFGFECLVVFVFYYFSPLLQIVTILDILTAIEESLK